MKTVIQPDEMAYFSINAILEKKGSECLVLDLKKLTSMTDLFIICSGESERQVKAIAEHIVFTLKKKGLYPLGIDGQQNAHWIIVDYGDFIVHVFKDDIRKVYSLETFWSKADIFAVEELKTSEEKISFEIVSTLNNHLEQV